MEKYKLIKLVQRTGKSFKNLNPTGVYHQIIENKLYEALSHVLKAKDLVIFSLLVPRFNMGSDIDEDYDRIEYNMFTIQLVEVYNTEPMVECSECHGNRFERCDHCEGDGEEECRYCDNTGEEDCDYCEGSGVDEEGEGCDMCQGSGRTTCGRCNGSGYESCSYCGGDGDVQCGYCGGDGKMITDEQSELTYTDFVSWSGRWKMYFADIKHHEQVDEEDSRNFYNNNQTLVLRTYEEISDEYQGYTEGDTFLFHMDEKPEITTRYRNMGVIII
jgi:hypothetical protein